jgi:hypothetical protein
MELERFKRKTVVFCDMVSVDGYMLPDGEFRVGVTSASKALGFAEAWLYKSLSNTDGKTLKALQGMGFTAFLKHGEVDREKQSGTSKVSTLSLDDFVLLVAYATSKQKKEAFALQLALTKMAVNDFFRDAFGLSPLTIDEKRSLFYKDYAKNIDWSLEDLLDWKLIEEQEWFLNTSKG